MAIAMMEIRTKKTLKPVDVELLFDKFAVEGSAFSEVVSVEVLFEVLIEDNGGRLLVASETEAGIGVGCSFDGIAVVADFIDGGFVVPVVCVSVEGATVDAFMLGGVGGVGLVGGVGACISKPPFRKKYNRIGTGRFI